MSKEKIRALMVEPTENPKICYLEPTMKSFKKAVSTEGIDDCEIEAKRIRKQVYAIFNKDRFLANLPPNRRIGDDIIAGTFYIVAINDKRVPISLTNDQIITYALRFWNTEKIDDMDMIEANMNTYFSGFWEKYG